MKAVIVEDFRPFDQAEVKEVPDPEPAPGEVVIDVRAAEVNYPDLMVIEGRYQNRPPFPFSPGKAAAGVVSALGEGVAGFAPGDRVAVEVEYGAYAEKLRVPAVNCYPLPDGLSFEAGAALGLGYQTAHFSLIEHGRMQPGETVLVLGASGGIGVAALQLAKALGASVVMAGTRGADGVAIAKKAGADAVIDLAMGDLRNGLRDAVRAATGGKGADIVVDPVGGEAGTAALRALAWCGRLIVVGFASGDIPSFAANYILVKNITVSGLHWSDYRDRDPDLVRRAQEHLYELYRAGKIDPMITGSFPLADYARALTLLHDGTAQGRIVLTVGD
jgi:NADPH2:quinone reductase